MLNFLSLSIVNDFSSEFNDFVKGNLQSWKRLLTLTRASVKLVHMAISSRVLISGYRLRLNVCSNSCSCCDVKCVLWRRCRLFFLSFFGSSDVIDSSTFSCFTDVSAKRDAVERERWENYFKTKLTCIISENWFFFCLFHD